MHVPPVRLWTKTLLHLKGLGGSDACRMWLMGPARKVKTAAVLPEYDQSRCSTAQVMKAPNRERSTAALAPKRGPVCWAQHVAKVAPCAAYYNLSLLPGPSATPAFKM
jgi:hypothetical protein